MIMTSMNRVRVAWTGFNGQPGLSTFYLTDATLDVTPIKTFLTAMSSFVPTGLTWTIPAFGDKIDDAQGDLVGSWVGTGGGTVVGSGGAAAYAGAAGLCIDWKTGTVVRNRRIQGRTYFVPGYVGIYQTDGSVLDSVRATVTSVANAMVASFGTNFLVWSRPFPGKAAEVGPPPKPAIPASDGDSGPVVAAFVPDISAVLRSRRG